MTESFDGISREIQGNKEKVDKLNSIVNFQDKIKNFSSNFQKVFDNIQDIKSDIQTLAADDDKASLQLQLDGLYADMADLYNNGNIDDSIIQKTYVEIQEITNEFKNFVETNVSKVRQDISVSVGYEYKKQNIAPVEVKGKPWRTTKEKLLFDIDGILADDIQTGGGDVIFTFYDENIIQQVLNGNINLGQNDTQIFKTLDGTIYCKIIFRDTKPEDIEGIGYETEYVPIEDVPGWKDLPLEDLYGIEGANMIMQVESFKRIIGNQNETVEEKYNKVLEIGRNLSTPQEKITFLSSFSIYLNGKYDSNLYEEKKSIFKGFLKNKSVGNDNILSEDPAGVCADHHRLTAIIAEELGFNAGVISTTSNGLHAITWLKNGDEYVLIDYGSVYTSTSPEDLVAQYYALHSATPKPFDIITDADGKIIGTLSTPLGKVIGEHLSPFENTNSADIALNVTQSGLQDINAGFDYTVNATNQNQFGEVNYGTKSKRHNFSGSVENNNNIDNANITGFNLRHTYQPSSQNQINSNLARNNIRWNNGNQANALGLSFGHTNIFKPINIGDVKLNSAMTSQLGVQFDARSKYEDINGSIQPGTIDFSDPINRQAPGFLGNTGYAVSTEDIQISNNINVQGYGSIQGNILPQDISSPANTLRIKPTGTLGGSANIGLGNQNNLSIGGNVSAMRYNKGARETGYNAQANYSSQNFDINAKVEGVRNSMAEESLLTNSFMLEVGAQRIPKTNIFGQQNRLSVFGNAGGRSVNGNQINFQISGGLRYSF